MTTTILTVVGQVVGYSFGGPIGAAVGGVIGGAIGGAIEGPQQVQGPRIEDLRTTGLSYGATIPQIYGHPRVPGVLAWASDKREVATVNSQGKGGPSVEATTYTYQQDCLFLLSANRNAGIARIWANGKLVWAIDDLGSSGNLQVIDPVTTGPTDYWGRLSVYPGGDDQLPDATYEAAVGVGNAPAYRGHLTVFIQDLNLGGSGYAPQLTFEITQNVSHLRLPVFKDSFTGDGPICVSVNDGSGAIITTMHLPEIRRHDITWDYNPAFGYDSLGNPLTYTSNYINGGYIVPRDYQDVAETVVNLQSDYDYWRISGVTGGSYDFGLSFYLEQEVILRDLDVTPDPENNDSSEIFIYHYEGPYFADRVRLKIESTIFPGEYTITASLGIHTLTEYHKTVSVQDVEPGSHVVRLEANGTEITASIFFDGVQIGASFSYYPGVSSEPIDGFSNLDLYGVAANTGLILLSRVEAGQIPVSATINEIYLSDVVSDLCVSSGLTEDYLDVSELADTVFQSYAITQVSPARAAIETLMQAYSFSAIEAASLRFPRRGASIIDTVSYDVLGASVDGDGERLPITLRCDVEVPAQVSVTYINPLNDYQSATEYSDRLIGDATGVRAVQMPLGLLPQEAKRAADIALMDGAVATTQIGPIALSMRSAVLEPTDSILIEDEVGTTYRAWISRINDAQGVRSIECLLEDAAAFESAALTDSGYTSSVTVQAAINTLLELLDIPILRDADNGAGHYGAVAPVESGVWPGATVYRGADDTGYAQVATFSDRTFIGQTTSVLPNYDGIGFDEVNTVNITGVGILENYSDASIISGSALAYLVGSEVLFAKRAVSLGSGAYRLEGLLRGRRGTDWAMGIHTSNDRVVLLGTQGLRRLSLANTQLGIEFSYRAPTLGKALSTATLQSFTDHGIALKPFAPVAIEGERDGSNNLTISWSRRTRLACRYGGALGANVPLGESEERYYIDILADSPPTVVRTLQSISQSVDYSAAEQTADGITPGESVMVVVYQVSSIVGRGYGRESLV